MTRPPQQVMRFYGNPQYALECIALKQITILHIDKLNDPFDPYFYFEIDCENYQALINHVQQHHPNDLHAFSQRLPKKNWESCVKGIEGYFKNRRNSTFIFSTCEISEDTHPKDNLYMWSHYGNGHRGVAIEFDTNLLARAVLEEQKRLGGSNLDPWFKINYQYELPNITCEQIFEYVMKYTNGADEEACYKTGLAKILRELVSSKSMVWKIEKEWRLMRQNDETRLKVLRLDLLDDTITAVYLGCRIADHMNDDLIFETKRHFPRAEIFKGRKVKGKFALDFERISVTANANT